MCNKAIIKPNNPTKIKKEPGQLKGKLLEHNSLINLTDRSFHFLGQSLIAEETILPLYISNFSNSKLLISLIPFLEALLFSVPQLFSLTRGLRKFKTLKGQIIFFGILERLPLLVLGILTFFINKLSPVFIIGSFFFLYSTYILTWGYPIPLWFDFIKKTIPENIKGSFFSAVQILKNISGLIGGVILSIIFKAFCFPHNFAYTFLITFIFMSISLLFFCLNKKFFKKGVDSNSSLSLTPKKISSLFSVFKDDTEFLFLSITFIFTTLLFSIIPFLSLYAKERFSLLDTSGSTLTVLFFGGQTIGSIIGGYWGNKHEYKKTMVLSIASGMVTILTIMFTKTIIIYYAGFLFVGFFVSTRKLAFLDYAMSSSKWETSVYTAIATNVTMPFQLVFPLLAGLIVEYFSYEALFILTLVFLLLSFFSFFIGSIKICNEKPIPQFEQIRSY